MNRALKKRLKIIGLSLITISLLLSFCACQGPGAPSPEISFTLPSEGMIIASSNISVSLTVDNFDLVNKIGNISGGQTEGHIIYYLDVSPPIHEGRTAMTQRGTYVATVEPAYTWQNVRLGKHYLSAQLVTSNNEPLNVPRVVTISIDIVRPPTAPVNIDLVVTYDFFDIDTITVPAGAEVVMTFVNSDDTPHNFSLYYDSSATSAIFRGEPITGPGDTTYRFRAPGVPGNYFFRSDSNPDTMTGTFIVTSK